MNSHSYTGKELDQILARYKQAERDRFWTAVWGAGTGGFLLACAIFVVVRFAG